MAIYWQIPRSGAFWLMLAFALCILPLARYLPPWVPVVAIVAITWRTGIYRGRWGGPGWLLKSLLVIACIGGLLFSFRRLYGLEPMVALLVCAFSLKLLEMHQRRDALVVIFLAYFVAITLALFDQGPLAALYIAVAIVAVTASLAGIHQPEVGSPQRGNDSPQRGNESPQREKQSPKRGKGSHQHRPLLTALRIVAQAIPLMLVFFLVMPRIGPLWGVPSPSTAITGMSDSLEFGDITRLGGSSAIAFRAEFDGEIPPRNQLYWRGVTLSRFDGRRWTRSDWWGMAGGQIQWPGETKDWWQAGYGETLPVGYPQMDYPKLSYKVTLEKTGGNWLYSLWYPEARTEGTGVMRDFTLISRQPVVRRMEYRVRSFPDAVADRALPGEDRRAIELRIPRDSNPETVQLAQRWARETPDTQKLIDRMLAYYQAGFSYTLTPPALGQHSVDDFLFRSRSGFCEHFAASFVFFMRAAGVPARIVAGYQGGEANPEEGYLTVRQYDAHAWAEVWIENKGWVQVDPTAAVAPERILSSLLDMMSTEVVFADAPFDLARYQGVGWLNWLRLQMEAMEYNWARWVLGYNSLQGDFLRKLLGGVDVWRIAVFLLASSLISLLPVLLLFNRSSRVKKHPADRVYSEFCRRLAKAGYPRHTGEAPRDYGARISAKFPALGAVVDDITSRYIALRYGPGGGDLAGFKKQVSHFRVRRQNR